MIVSDLDIDNFPTQVSITLNNSDNLLFLEANMYKIRDDAVYGSIKTLIESQTDTQFNGTVVIPSSAISESYFSGLYFVKMTFKNLDTNEFIFIKKPFGVFNKYQDCLIGITLEVKERELKDCSGCTEFVNIDKLIHINAAFHSLLLMLTSDSEDRYSDIIYRNLIEVLDCHCNTCSTCNDFENIPSDISEFTKVIIENNIIKYVNY